MYCKNFSQKIAIISVRYIYTLNHNGTLHAENDQFLWFLSNLNKDNILSKQLTKLSDG